MVIGDAPETWMTRFDPCGSNDGFGEVADVGRQLAGLVACRWTIAAPSFSAWTTSAATSSRDDPGVGSGNRGERDDDLVHCAFSFEAREALADGGSRATAECVRSVLDRPRRRSVNDRSGDLL